MYFVHDRTKILDVGIRVWHKNGLPVTRDIAKPAVANFVPKINQSIRIEAEELHKKIDAAVIIDARSPQEFMADRICNAILFPFIEGGSLFKEKDELLRIFSEQQIPKDGELVCYCALGHRAVNVFAQLKMAGYENVNLYDGSFADWIGRRLPLG